jgi:hypothetical protein
MEGTYFLETSADFQHTNGVIFQNTEIFKAVNVTIFSEKAMFYLSCNVNRHTSNSHYWAIKNVHILQWQDPLVSSHSFDDNMAGEVQLEMLHTSLLLSDIIPLVQLETLIY